MNLETVVSLVESLHNELAGIVEADREAVLPPDVEELIELASQSGITLTIHIYPASSSKRLFFNAIRYGIPTLYTDLAELKEYLHSEVKGLPRSV